MAGERELELDVRPVVLDQVEVVVRLTTQSRDASKPHSKRAYLYASPAAPRNELVQGLRPQVRIAA
jgi:hypothetical protein